MIKVGIIGGSNPMAGELIRLLINHPDITLKWVNSARFAGRLLSDIHHGLIGETDQRITPTADLSTIDALFIFRHRGQTLEWMSQNAIPDQLRIIDLSVDYRNRQEAEKEEFVYGLPELNRKPMVRGAKRAVVPHPAANAIDLALMPLAKLGIASGQASAIAEIPESVDEEATAADIIDQVLWGLSELQSENLPKIDLSIQPADDERVMTTTVSLPTTLNIGQIAEAFEEFYDDHNFVFVVAGDIPANKEVEGTNKCLIHLDKTDGRMVATLKMDALIKGAAGTAVHDMNLLFGLHERVGLTLKASKY